MDFTTLAKVAYSDQLILTTEQLAEFYGCDISNIKKNFNANKDRFIEGKHYFKLEGEALKNFKNMVTKSYSVDGNMVPESYPVVGKNANVLYLWTKQGAARHAKMLSTEKAWEVFELLEDNYFNAKEKFESSPKVENAVTVQNQPPVIEAAELAIRAVKDIATLSQIMKQYLDMSKTKAILNAILIVESVYEFNFDNLKNEFLAIEKNVALFTPTQIGELIGGKSAQFVNKKLCEIGFQKKDRMLGYILTEKGKEYGKLVSYNNNGHIVRQIKWSAAVSEFFYLK